MGEAKRKREMAAVIGAGNNKPAPAEAGDEFDCADCGRHIIAYPAGTALFTDGRCSSCAFMPGWFLVPELKTALEPDREWQPPERRPNDPGNPASWVCEVPGCGARTLLLRISEDGAPLRHRCPDHLHRSIWAVLHESRNDEKGVNQ